jgi:hypothetical protein
VKGKQQRGSLVFGKSSSITKNFESREFGRELTTNNTVVSAFDNATRNPPLAKQKSTKQVPASGPASQRGEKQLNTFGPSNKATGAIQQS